MTNEADIAQQALEKYVVLNAGTNGGYWCHTCQDFIGNKVEVSFRGILVLRWHSAGRATHSVRKLAPFERAPKW